MGARQWGERHFAARAAFTLTFFLTAAVLYVHYRILYNDLLFPGNPFLSIAVPAFIAALVMSLIARSTTRARQRSI